MIGKEEKGRDLGRDGDVKTIGTIVRMTEAIAKMTGATIAIIGATDGDKQAGEHTLLICDRVRSRLVWFLRCRYTCTTLH